MRNMQKNHKEKRSTILIFKRAIESIRWLKKFWSKALDEVFVEVDDDRRLKNEVAAWKTRHVGTQATVHGFFKSLY